MTTRRQGRGAVGPAALGLLPVMSLVAGLLLVGVAVAGQVPDPPRPAGASVVEDAGPRSAPAAEGDVAAPQAGSRRTEAPRADAQDGVVALAADRPAATPVSPRGTEEPATAAPLPAAEPVAVRVPAIGVQSPLHALGLAADGTLEVPSGALVDQAAWYSGSPTPGEAGPSVVEGHVTGPGGRPSVFFELASLAPGDRVEVDRADGGTVVFEVYRVESHPKDRFPTVAVYGPTAGPELRLITCGGEFDEATGHHVDNTVVFAQAVEHES